MDEEILERVLNLRLMDDIFFNAFMQDNPEGMEYVLNIIMERDDLKVIRLETQYEIPGIIARGVRFDVFCVDAEGKLYDFEVQNDNYGVQPRRARYNSSMMDHLHLQRGDDWESLPQTCVIMITEHDVLGEGRPIYHIERYIKESGSTFNDGCSIIYVNGEYRDKGTPIGRLMADFHCRDVQEMDSEVLARRAGFLKSSENEVSKMCKSVEEYAEKKAAERATKAMAQGMEQGMAKGMEKGIFQATVGSIKSLMEKADMSAEKAMELLGVPKADFAKYLTML